MKSNLPDQIKTISRNSTSSTSLIPPFQRKFPAVFIATLGFSELFAGLIVLALELFIFDIALGLWCGSIYIMTGLVTVVLGLLKEKSL